jgi:alpha-ketoglutarate-dependent taurine dioxygenase
MLREPIGPGAIVAGTTREGGDVSTITTTKLSETIGVEVQGLDTERLLADLELPHVLLDVLDEYGVLVFHDLFLDPETQVAFCGRLGEVDMSPGHHRVPGIYWLTMEESKNPHGGYLRATFDWHIDGCTPMADEYPQKATVLTAVALGDQGAVTEFASSYAAYDDLTDDAKERFASLRVLHTFEASQRRCYPDPTPEQVAQWRIRPPREHPLVWHHHNGRRSLVLTPTTDYIIGMGYDEGRELLDDLVCRATGPDRVYRHEWRAGDTVIWDNRGVFHRAVPYEAASQREMLRTTLLGEEPIR